MVPGIWEDPSVRDRLAGGRERRGGPSWPQGSTLHSDPFDRIRGAVIVSGYFLLNWGVVGAEGRGWIPVTFRGPQGLWAGVWSIVATIKICPVAVWVRSLTLRRMIGRSDV